MTTEIESTPESLQHHIYNIFTQFELYVSSILPLERNLSWVPTFCEFYYRNDRALDTTFAEIPGSRQKMNWHTWKESTTLDDMFLLHHGKFLTKTLLHLKITVDPTHMILYYVHGKKSGGAYILLTSLLILYTSLIRMSLRNYIIMHKQSLSYAKRNVTYINKII